jgi:hypothetical protein
VSLNLFKGPGNNGFDLARIIGASASVTYPFPFIWNVIAHGAVPEPSAFGTGYAAVLVAVGALIAAKDIGVAKANATTAAAASQP